MATRKATTAKKMTPAAAAKQRTAISKKKMLHARAMVTKVLKKDDPGIDIDPGLAKKSRPHISTGSLILDYLIGGRPNMYGVAPCPGWPKGAISNIYGHESSGKTTVALMAAAEVCRNGGSVCFIDWEHALDLSYAQALGVPVSDQGAFFLVQPNTLEAGLKVLYIMAKHEVDLIILDSVGAPVPEAVAEQSADEQGKAAQIGAISRAWSQYLPKLVTLISKTGTHVMGISQVRAKIDARGFGKKTTEQGGNAWKFYASVRMMFARIQAEKGKIYNALANRMEEQVVASKIKAKIEKSKVSQSQQHELPFWVVFGEGIDNLRSIIEVAVNHKLILKKGAWFYWDRSNGEQIKGQGIAKFRQELEAADALDELYHLAMATIQKAQEKGNHMVIDDDEEEEIDMDAIMDEASADFDLEAMKEDPPAAALDDDK